MDTKKTKVSPIWKVLFLLLIAYLSLNLINQQQLIEKKNGELAEVEAKIAAEEKTSAELAREKSMLMSDESLEKIAREKLGMVKPGERVFVDLNRQ
ncbi:MAG: septum formation initiator family protein [Clostridiales bacterium]|nr:septum formation initiator family protein [Clostridiales bacterium]